MQHEFRRPCDHKQGAKRTALSFRRGWGVGVGGGFGCDPALVSSFRTVLAAARKVWTKNLLCEWQIFDAEF